MNNSLFWNETDYDYSMLTSTDLLNMTDDNNFEPLPKINCFSYSSGFNKVKKYYHIKDYKETSITCDCSDQCVKYTIAISKSDLAVWKGCYCKFQTYFGFIMGEHTVNECYFAKSSEEGTLCLCNDKEYCNSNSKNFLYSTFFITLLSFLYHIKNF